MEHTEHTDNPVHTRIMLLMLAVVLLVTSIVGYILSSRIQSNQQGGGMTRILLPTTAPSPVPTLIPYPTKGSFVLKERSGRTILQPGAPFIIDLIATSGTDSVAGYDAVLSYDASAFQRQSVQNGNDSFRIFSFDRSAHLSVSATKNLQVNETIRFTDTLLLSFTFVATKKGVYTFSLKPVGNESAKLVDERAQVTYPATSDFRIEIR